MEAQQSILQRILNERQPLLRRILSLFIAYSTIGALAVAASLFINGPQPIVMINALISAAIVGVLIWARQAVGTPALNSRLQIFLFLMLALIISSAITNQSIIFIMPATVLLSVILFSILGIFHAALWLGYVSVIGFFVTGMLEALGYLEAYHSDVAGSDISTVVTLTFMFGMGIALLKIYNDILLQSIGETTQRQQEAEAAEQQVATSLLQSQAQTSEQQRLLALISDLETPAVPVLPGVLALPIVGHLDSHRIIRLTESLLERVSAERASTVLLDLTGVNLVDTATANHLIQMVRSVRLLGTQCIITGIRAEVAQTMVTLGINWSDIPTSASLQNAIQSILDSQAQ